MNDSQTYRFPVIRVDLIDVRQQVDNHIICVVVCVWTKRVPFAVAIEGFDDPLRQRTPHTNA